MRLLSAGASFVFARLSFDGVNKKSLIIAMSYVLSTKITNNPKQTKLQRWHKAVSDQKAVAMGDTFLCVGIDGTGSIVLVTRYYTVCSCVISVDINKGVASLYQKHETTAGLQNVLYVQGD